MRFCFQRKHNIVISAISILLNSAQCEVNHSALYSLRILNDLLQFTKASDTKIKGVATMAMAFLIREENAHLLHSSSKSGVIQFLLDRLEATMYKDDHRADGFACSELLGGLLHVALNDANKVILVYDGILPILSHVLQNGSQLEKMLAADLTWSLSFQPDNKYSIQGEAGLIEALDDLACKGEGELKVKAKGALCQLEITRDRIYRVLERQAKEHRENSETGKCCTVLECLQYGGIQNTMMIAMYVITFWLYCTEGRTVDVYLSYHPNSNPVFTQLKDVLKTEGFSVTSVDHGAIDGNVFGHVTSCIERSKVVIMEISRLYQRSLFCRTGKTG